MLLGFVAAALGVFVALLVAWAYHGMPYAIARPSQPRTPAEWLQVQEVFTAALELPSGEQQAFVRSALAGNRALCREVHSLLAAHSHLGVLDHPPPDLPQPLIALSDADFPARHGTISRYEILEKLGAGAMGVVYKARDLRLDRVVALKFLPPHLVADDLAKDRFLVEAQAAAALDHPNICTIHEIGETDEGHLFLAMPFYDGETLKHRLANGMLAHNEAADIAIQIARGLASAHDRGIVHRDIKPANLVVTRESVVKIVDFGIAKLADVSLTGPGMTPGTVAYMSPEQARGDEVDGRTDLWSLGVVLYEMLAGERPFRGTHDGVVLQAIQRADPPPIGTLRSDVSAALAQVVSRTLAKARDDRYSTAREVVEALESASASLGGVPSATASPAAVRSGGVASLAAASAERSSDGALSEGERRRVTIVASTLSGFAELVGNLGPEDLERLVGRIREEVGEVAVRHGGTLNRFTGDEILLLFGVPLTHEDDGVRAVRSALELHARMRVISESIEQAHGLTLRLHTGIDTGRVIVQAKMSAEGDRAYHLAGSAAEIAACLTMHAGIDEVWAGPACHYAIHPFFDTVPRDAFAVRGRSQPLIPHLVLGASGSQSRFDAAEKAGLTPFVGRVVELDALQRCLEAAVRGEGQFVTVTGEAGIGKSRLLHEFRSTLAGRQLTFLLGRCQSDAIGVSYLPFIEILRTVLRLGEAGSDGVLASTIAGIREIGAELEEFIPLYLHLLSIPSGEFPVPQHLHGETFRTAIQEALTAILTLSARRAPCVVLLEDWHWADEASIAALKQVAEVASGFPLLIAVTSRHAFGVEWETTGERTAIPLQSLDARSLAALLASLLGVQRVPVDLGALLHERTGGNPFFLEQICLTLLEEGAIRVESSEARLTRSLQHLELPDSVEAVIRARLDRLDRTAYDVLRLASVVGQEFTRRILESTLADTGGLPDALKTLKAAGLVQQTHVVPEAAYRFKHVLTRDVAYSSLLEHQRRDLHGRVGACIEHLGQERIEDHFDRLAHHFSRAEDWEKAIRYGIRSAERAGALAQYAEALQILERTQRRLINLPDGEQRQVALLEILLRQERLAETLGLRGRQQQIIDEVIHLLEPDADAAMLAEAYLRQGDLYTLLRRFDEGEAALQRSLALRRGIADDLGTQKALRSLGLLRWHGGRNREALTCISEVVAMDRERNDIVALVGDLSSLAIVRKALGEPDVARARLKEGIAIAEAAIAAGSPAASDLRVKQAYILNALAILCREAGDLDGALDYLDRSEKIAEVKRLPVYQPYHHAVAAHVYLQQGNVEKSLARYGTAVEQVRKAKHIPGLSQALSIQGEVLLGLKRYDEALPCLMEAAGLLAQMEDREAESRMWTEIAAAHEGVADYAAAIAAWSKARTLRKQLKDAAGELEALEGLAAATRCQIADPAFALAHYNEAIPLADALGDRAAEGRLRNTSGILEWSRGEFARALDHYERAFVIFRDLEDLAHAGLMLNSAGSSLKELGRLDEAQCRFEEAIAVHRETGQRQLEGHALAALGDISMMLDEPAAAAVHYERSLDIRRAIGDRRGEGWMLYRLARSDGAGAQAGAVVENALGIAEACGDHELATACDALRRTSLLQPPS